MYKYNYYWGDESIVAYTITDYVISINHNKIEVLHNINNFNQKGDNYYEEKKDYYIVFDNCYAYVGAIFNSFC